MTQTHEHHWVFGDGVHLEFVGGAAPSLGAPTTLSSVEACASICDPVTGTLLFYTDGEKVWDIGNNVIASNIGGANSSFQGAIIVPPAGSGSHYHIFTTYAVEQNGGPRDLIHSSYLVSGSTVTQIIPPTPMLGVQVSEHLAAISKPDCSGYWVVTREVNSNNLHVVSVDGDVPTVLGAQSLPISPGSIGEVGQMKFSPDGKHLAWADVYSNEVNIADFDNNTGTITTRNVLKNVLSPMGLEFSPNSKILYYTEQSNSNIFQHDIASALPSPTPIDNALNTPVVMGVSIEYHSLQIAPDGKIYIVGMNRNTMSVITSPDTLGSGMGFVHDALDSSGNILTFPTLSTFATPNFTRILRNCSEESGCNALIDDVNKFLEDKVSQTAKRLKDCDGRRPRRPNCRDLRLPQIRPHIEVRWANSNCDCLESDDIETLLVTICNPYKNVTFSHVGLAQNSIIDNSGKSVSILPNGDPSVEVVPKGAICFGDILPCSCITREVTVRTRGAMTGDYKLSLDGICFDVCIHHDMSACFQLSVCDD